MRADTIGFIYVLSNPAMPGLVKIGKTALVPFRRAAELSASTSSPAAFRVEYYILSADCDKAERLVHDRLQSLRVTGGREFFHVDVQVACQAIEEAALEAGFLHKGGNDLRQWISLINDRLEFDEPLTPDMPMRDD